MTGTSARETSRPAKRPRPSATDHPSHTAPPVLFRLPSISQPAHEEDRFGTPATMPHSALAMGIVGSAAASLATSMQVAPQMATPKPVTAPAPAPGLADQKAAGQRLLNTIVVVVLLIALAIISLLAFRGGQPEVEPQFADSEKHSNDHLESLSDIRVPDISKPQAQSANVPSASAQSAAGQGIDANVLPAASLQLSLDRSKSAATVRPGLTLDAADLAKKPSGGAAQVQLGTPVPMRSNASSALAASQETASQTANPGLPLTTPRYETVSTPSPSGGAVSGGSSIPTGASPSLWDGAKKPAEQPSPANAELMLSGSNDAEMSLIPSDYSNSSAKPTSVQPVSSKSPAPANSGAQAATTDSSSLGVTVGAGMSEPEFPQAKATATPNLDVAAISSRFIEYSRQKSVAPASTATEFVNPYAPAAGQASASAPVNTVATNGSTAAAYQQSPASAGVPYGSTGATLTPYVRNSPTGAVPSGLGNGSTQSAYPTGNPATTAPMSGPAASTVYPSLSTAAGYPQSSAPNAGAGNNTGYSAQAGGGNSFAIPPRGTTTASPQMTAGAGGTATAPAQTGAYGYPAAQNYGYASGAGATAPAGSANYQSATVSRNAYPSGGQPPQGMIGQSGFATAPSGDVAPPMPVTGTVGYGTSPTR